MIILKILSWDILNFLPRNNNNTMLLDNDDIDDIG